MNGSQKPESPSARWRRMSLVALQSARLLLDRSDFRGSVNRAYYAAYQGLTSLSVQRGDPFGRGWNNPPHEQLPELIRNNGDLTVEVRRMINTQLNFLRNAREDADYRPGITVDRQVAARSLRSAAGILHLAGIQEDD